MNLTEPQKRAMKTFQPYACWPRSLPPWSYGGFTFESYIVEMGATSCPRVVMRNLMAKGLVMAAGWVLTQDGYKYVLTEAGIDYMRSIDV